MRERVDKKLHQLGLFESRKKAQVAIEKGLVTRVLGERRQKIMKPSEEIESHPDESWEITPDVEFEFVSRSGAKLKTALADFGCQVAGKFCLDLGVSTGGFAECLLRAGAAHVVGVDVGREQLHTRLRAEPRLLAIDQINAREPLPSAVLQSYFTVSGRSDWDLIVCDVSFISAPLVVQPQLRFLRPGGELIVLVKPQFEVGRSLIGKKGIVAPEEGLRALEKTVKTIESFSLKVLQTAESVLKGEDGNQEYFIHALAPLAHTGSSERGSSGL